MATSQGRATNESNRDEMPSPMSSTSSSDEVGYSSPNSNAPLLGGAAESGDGVELVKRFITKQSIAIDQLGRFAAEYEARFCESSRNEGEWEYLNRCFRNTDGVAALLNSSTTYGIADTAQDSLVERRLRYGSNRKSLPPKRSFMSFWLEAVRDRIMLLLMGCAALSLVLALVTMTSQDEEDSGEEGLWMEPLAILCSVMIVTTTVAIMDNVQQTNFAHLQSSQEHRCVVKREGKLVSISTDDVVVGDLVKLEDGMDLPCDMLITIGHVFCDESALTGESQMMEKQPFEDYCWSDWSSEPPEDAPSFLLYGGSNVAPGGQGWALAIGVGENCKSGESNKLANLTDFPTPLQGKLKVLSKHISILGAVASIVIFLTLICEFWIRWSWGGDHDLTTLDFIQTHLYYLQQAVTVVVVAVPEGLPLAVVISLAFSVRLMKRDMNYMKRLKAVEVMGCCTDILTDKTGTITENRMAVQRVYIPDDSPFPKLEELTPIWKLIIENGMMNSTALLGEKANDEGLGASTETTLGGPSFWDALTGKLCKKRENPDIKRKQSAGKTLKVGNTSEAAILQYFFDTFGLDKGSFCREYLGDRDEVDVIEKSPFTSEKKTSAVIIKISETLHRLYVKGAAEIVLSLSSKYQKNDVVVRMDEEERFKILNAAILPWAGDALRCFAFAYRDFNPKEFTDWNVIGKVADGSPPTMVGRMKVENELTFCCVVALRDTVRREVNGAMESCHSSHVRVRMVTGDSKLAARAIAIECGLVTEAEAQNPDAVMEGADFYSLIGGLYCSTCEEGKESCRCNEMADFFAMDKDERAPFEVEMRARYKVELEEWKSGGKIGPKPVLEYTKSGAQFLLVRDIEKFVHCELNLRVLARSRPIDKLAFVIGLQQLRKVVGVTGDGTNDAPALKRADVGFAMGIAGQDAAKNAADIILLDDNFAGIVKAILWGRNIYCNLFKFLQFQLTINITAVTVVFLSIFLYTTSVFSTVMLLWLNIIMDTLAALALATERPDKELLMESYPVQRDAPLMTADMRAGILTNSIFQIFVVLFVYLTGEMWIPEVEWLSVAQLEDIQTDYPNYTQFNPVNWGGYNTVTNGRGLTEPFTGEPAYARSWLLDPRIGCSRHITVVFNGFVLMQLANLVLSRQIGISNTKVFKGITANPMWLIVFIIVLVGQGLIVTYGGLAVPSHPMGLTAIQWLICVLLFICQFIYGILIRLVPWKTITAKIRPHKETTRVEDINAWPSYSGGNNVMDGENFNERNFLDDKGKMITEIGRWVCVEMSDESLITIPGTAAIYNSINWKPSEDQDKAKTVFSKRMSRIQLGGGDGSSPSRPPTARNGDGPNGG